MLGLVALATVLSLLLGGAIVTTAWEIGDATAPSVQRANDHAPAGLRRWNARARYLQPTGDPLSRYATPRPD